MKTKKQIEDKAKELGAVLIDDSDSHNYDVSLWLDDGRTFDSSGSSCIRVTWFADGNKSEFWQESWDDLTAGIQ